MATDWRLSSSIDARRRVGWHRLDVWQLMENNRLVIEYRRVADGDLEDFLDDPIGEFIFPSPRAALLEHFERDEIIDLWLLPFRSIPLCNDCNGSHSHQLDNTFELYFGADRPLPPLLRVLTPRGYSYFELRENEEDGEEDGEGDEMPDLDPPDDFIEEDDDLFGDDDEGLGDEQRQLSDRELDSGDDEDRNDRAPDRTDGIDQSFAPGDREARVLDATIPRHPVPMPPDGELHTLRIPKFLSVEPAAFDRDQFTIPSADHHSTTKSDDFSASATAATTIRYRKNPETGKLESNTVLNRWSDGSVTLSIGDNIYELTAKELTNANHRVEHQYVADSDSHQYAATPYMSSQLMQIVGHITNQFDIRPNKAIEDVAIAKLQDSLLAAARGRGRNDMKDGIAIIAGNQDPELLRRQAEQAEKDRLKAQRRREAAATRADQQLGPRPRAPTSALGLGLDDIEGRHRTGGGRKRSAPSRPKRQRRRRTDYDSDEDDRAGGREDEYDLNDDFLVDSDEEPEVEGEDEESEEESIEESEKEDNPKPKKAKREDTKADVKADIGSDMDAEGEDDDVPLPAASEAAAGDAGRGRKRNIIEDDDDE